MIRPHLIACLLALVPLDACLAAEPKLMDFAEGVQLTASPDQPLLQVTIPDRVFTTVTQWQLADLRVFNSNNEIVPHAFCSTPALVDTVQSVDVMVYRVSNLHGANDQGNHSSSIITLRTADGAQLNVQTNQGTSEANTFRNASYVIDVRHVSQPLHAVTLDWSIPDASEISVRILSSDDLSHWQTVVSTTQLLRATANNHSTLEQHRIALPVANYQYLRIEPVAADAALDIKQVSVEYKQAAAVIDPTWYSAGAPHAAENAHELRYENSHRVPISFIRIQPHSGNSSLHVTVESRDQPEHAWHVQWAGEVFDIHFKGETRRTGPIQINTTSAREWRLLFAESAEPPVSAPTFDFGYAPIELRFIAQGTGPYLLVYGSARQVQSNAVACDSLLSSFNTDDKQQLLGMATLGITKTLAGNDALRTTHQPPTRTLVLWSILLIGVGIIMKMAFSLLKRNRQQDQG